MARDTQRQKVYDAEQRAFGQPSEQLDVKQMQALVDKWGSSKVVQRHYPRAHKPVEVTDGRSRRRGAYHPRLVGPGQIRMPRHTRCKWYLVHEYAHHLTTGERGAWHGWQFCEAYLYLMRVVIGKQAEEQLKREFKAGKARFRPPVKRAMSETQRQAARERMIALNAAKQTGPVSTIIDSRGRAANTQGQANAA